MKSHMSTSTFQPLSPRLTGPVQLLSLGHSMCGWKVAVARPCIGYIRLIMLYSADEVCGYIAPLIECSSVCNPSSEVKWSGDILRCLNGRACCFLFPVGGGRLLVVSEYQWLTLAPPQAFSITVHTYAVW